MNISGGNMNIGTVPQNVSSVAKTDAVTPVNQQTSGNADIVSVKEGQVFNGTILDVNGKNVSIMLDNNKTLMAQMAESMNFSIGDELQFLVRENLGSLVNISPYGDSAGQVKNQTILNILDANNISPTEKNYNIVDTLMRNNMPVDKASMQKLMQQSYKFPEAKLDTLAALNKLGIPVTAESINQYESYLNGTHQLTGDISNMASGVADIVSGDIASMGDAGQMLEALGNLLESISDETDLPVTGENMAAAEGEAVAENAVSTGETIADNAAAKTDATNVLGKMSAEVKTTAQPQETAGMISTDYIGSQAERLSIKEETLKSVTDSLKGMGIPEETIKKAVDESDSSMKLLNNINELLKNNDIAKDVSRESLSQLLSSDGFKALTEQAVKEKFTLDPNKMQDPNEVNELYKSMYEKAGKLMESFSGSGSQAGSNMEQAAKGMQERIDFMQDLSSLYGYAQLPVRFEDREANSDLFVYMNKKSIKQAKDQVSALLHLDMDHLGPTDCHVSLRGTVVQTKFYVEDALSAKLIDQHMSMLEQAVAENGFTLSNETILREPTLDKAKVNPVVQEIVGNDLEKSVKRYSFDVRM